MPYFHHVFYIAFYSLKFDWCSFNHEICCAIFLCNGLIAPDWKICATNCLSWRTKSYYLHNNGWKHVFIHIFSFADFLEMRLKFALHLDRNLPTEKRPTVPPSPINPISLSYTPGIPTDEVSGGVQILMWVWAKGEAV